jgi:Histidine kinase-, DNA gyrase B-, and HSP90-like ATPase
MSSGYEDTRLWRTSLAEQPVDPNRQERARLRNAYYSFRERAAILAAEIPQDLGEYTVHDATHLDALWELADLIAGVEVALTPTEAFVLGGAFLLHDLGMGLAAWPGGMTELTKEPGWKDILATTIGELSGRAPLPDELDNPPSEVLERAKRIALRERHASHAAELGMTSWIASGTENRYHLIEDEDLRFTFGNLIGRIAASHWQTIDYLSAEFSAGPIGAPVDCPGGWTVEPLKLSCLLRLADAAHVDARRAPGFLMALRSPAEESRDHWIFQGHLQKPQLSSDQLVYTSPLPFTQEESKAWWICFDTIQMIDRELHGVDALLADRSQQRMAARSVKGADSPSRLNLLIPTAGWTPVDARVVVSNVAELARKLGGESLYGPEPHAALRELIQNASDACRALAALTGSAPQGIKVILRKIDSTWWLNVVDHGVGMSQQLMAGPLLDFGRTYWGSTLMREESPGLAASGFEPAGKYGIGFYATFMLGTTVNVISRRYDAAASDTKVLSFAEGLGSRPIIRPARREEVLTNGGTIVAVKLRVDPYRIGGILRPTRYDRGTLNEVCGRLAPALGVDLSTVEAEGAEQPCVSADDWKTMPGVELIRRLSRPLPFKLSHGFPIDGAANGMRTIERDGQVIARASLDPPLHIADPETGGRSSQGKIVSGGLEVGAISSINGIFLGVPIKADRAKGRVLATRDELSKWATEQAQIWHEFINGYWRGGSNDTAMLCELGADITGLHICCSRDGYLDSQGLAAWAATRTEISVLESEGVDVIETQEGLDIWDSQEHVLIDIGEDTLISFDPQSRYKSQEFFGGASDDESSLSEESDEDSDYGHTIRQWREASYKSIDKLMVQAVADAWGLDLDIVLRECITFYSQETAAATILDAEDETTYLYLLWGVKRPSP